MSLEMLWEGGFSEEFWWLSLGYFVFDFLFVFTFPKCVHSPEVMLCAAVSAVAHAEYAQDHSKRIHRTCAHTYAHAHVNSHGDMHDNPTDQPATNNQQPTKNQQPSHNEQRKTRKQTANNK